MATLFLPASPSLFPIERPPMEEDGDNDSIPELRLTSEDDTQDWNADAVVESDNSDLPFPSATTRTRHSRLETTTETEEPAEEECNTPDTSMDTTVSEEDDEEAPSPAAIIIGEESSTMIDQEMDQALMEDDDDSTIGDATSIAGGLNNLGNTCYMASAIQMLASLDPLMDRLLAAQQHNQQQDSSSLLDAFLQLFTRLRKGETVRPNELKEVLDEKSPLFCGYDQQDAHEFITTLLDILDEEYKKQQQKPQDNKKQQDETAEENHVPVDNGNNDTTVNQSEDDNDSTEDAASSVKEDELDSEMDLETVQDEGYVVVSRTPDRPALLGGTEEVESPSKRFKADVVDVSSSQENEEADSEQSEPPAMVRSPSVAASFSELNVDEIGLLLFGEPGPGSISTSCCGGDVTPTAGPKYKLVGGRMSINPDQRYESVTAKSPMDHVPENDEEDNDAMPSETVQQSEDAQQNSQSPGEARVNENESQQQEKKQVSPVESYLATEARVRLTCDSCKYTRTHKETFWHLSLELESNSTANSVQDGLARFFAPEQRQLKCEKCFCETATQTMQITKLPRALLLHFKRFIVEVSDDYSSISYRKNTSPVAFESHMSVREHKLDDDDDDTSDSSSSNCVLSEFLAPDCILPPRSDYLLKPCCGGGLQLVPQPSEYTLKSVVNHIGSSASCGHYTADSLRKSSASEKQWLRFNDSYVSRITETQATGGAASTAYMVLYEME